MRPTCKKCGSSNSVKNGVAAGKQRHKHKERGCNFRAGGRRANEGACR